MYMFMCVYDVLCVGFYCVCVLASCRCEFVTDFVCVFCDNDKLKNMKNLLFQVNGISL